MNKLEKDFLFAWALGMVLPALILGLFLAVTGDWEEQSADGTVNSATESVAVMPAPQLTVPVLAEDGTIEDMELETYLCGVVLAEMPADFETEALKAQSVVARTYALRRWEQGTKHPGGAICTEPSCCQGYLCPDDYLSKGGDQSDIAKISAAVWETAGQVLLYNGELIEATYFSCSGGMTEDASAVWGSDVPYLQSTVSPGEEEAAVFSDSQSVSAEAAASALGVEFTGDPDDWFRIQSYTSGGGVDKILVCGKEFTGVQIRKLLSLRSTNFTVAATENEIVFHTRGYGHRVGMSQYGADAMALSGSTYDEILSYYYRGTTLARYRSED